MRFRQLIWVLGLIFSFSLSARPLKVVTTIPELAWLVKQVGDEYVEAVPLLEGTENPHYVDAVPKFIAEVAGADMVVLVGLDLEVGWLPKVLSRSGNAKVQPGGKGYVEAGSAVTVLDVPQGKVDRSMGDVHPSGNPHFWLSPGALAQAAAPVTNTLIALDPAHANAYMSNQEEFGRRMRQLVKANKERLAPLQTSGQPWVMEYHKEFTYFFNEYGLESMGTLEEKPGVPPSAGRIARVAMEAKAKGVRVILAADYSPQKPLERFSEIAGIPVLRVPTSIRAQGKFRDYVKLQNHLVEEIVTAAEKTKPAPAPATVASPSE